MPAQKIQTCCGRADWHCGYCLRHHVVPILARDCEARHEQES